MIYILAVDDDANAAVMYHWYELERAGMSLIKCSTAEEAINEFSKRRYDLILLDAQLDDKADHLTGLGVHRYIRETFHEMPIILLSNFAGKKVIDDFVNKDPATRAVHKVNTTPSELVGIVQDFITYWPEYYARDNSDSSIQLIYETCGSHDVSLLRQQWPNHECVFLDTLTHYIENDLGYSHKLVRKEDKNEMIQGVIYTGGSSETEWLGHTLFESAPWNRYDRGDGRELRRVGKILVARMIRECESRGTDGRFGLDLYGMWEREANRNAQTEEQIQVHVGKAGAFFEALGFKPFVPGNSEIDGLYWLPLTRAKEIPNEVSF